MPAKTIGTTRDIPALRRQVCNDFPVRTDGDYVLYWMIAYRRGGWNFALQHAVNWAIRLGKPVLVLEPLRIGYPWASDRFHRFVIDGMENNRRWFSTRAAAYYPYVEPESNADKGFLAAVARRACLVVTDEFPAFFLPRMVQAAAAKIPTRFELVDANGLLPLRAADQVFTTAFSLRSFLQKNLPPHLAEFPLADPLADVELPRLAGLPAELISRWPPASEALLNGDADALRALPIDHGVPVVAERGGAAVATQRLDNFLEQQLTRYASEANQPDAEARSGLSPYLHFGHISVHEIFRRLMARERWSPDKLAAKSSGKRSGWWGVSESAESWLDELVTWRELGFNMCSKRNDYDRYESLPDWALRTLAKHRADPRPYRYSLSEFESAGTHDAIWNAAQIQLLREGRIHNYLRMLWGKKILEWSATPEEALAVMIELNNKYAVDGRDPNSYSGIFWVLGRYDRAWGPERPIYGTVRYMSSDNTRRKLSLERYLERYGQSAI